MLFLCEVLQSSDTFQTHSLNDLYISYCLLIVDVFFVFFSGFYVKRKNTYESVCL